MSEADINAEVVMRIFITGASGWIGSAITAELLGAGHEVIGLARSDASAAAIEAAGAKAHRGSLEDLDSLRAGAAASDGVVHMGFIHDFSQFADSIRVDQEAIEAIGAELAGSDRPFLIASGAGARPDGQPGTEHDMPDPNFPRTQAAITTLAFAEQRVRSGVVRLPPTVHGDGDKGFIATLIQVARDRGVSGYVGDGTRWSAVHRFDAAHLVCLALDRAPAGTVLHAVAEGAIPTRTIAEVIGRQLDVPVRSIDPVDMAEHFGWIGMMFAMDRAATSEATRTLLDWEPTHSGLIDDLEAGHYFD
jgi:nucleoside-diphosphate-sugar epimerase